MSTNGQEAPVLAAQHLTKAFGGTPVLRDVSLDIMPGEIHGLVGQNGSGKSTLIKILAGYHAPEPEGRLKFGGVEVSLPLSPGEFRGLGMSFVHQNLSLVDSLSVLDNVRVGRHDSRALSRIDWKRERQIAEKALERFDLEIDVLRPVGELADAERALVAIARAVQEIDDVASSTSRRGLLVLDEPTPYLSEIAVQALFDAMRRVVSDGTACLFVSHRLDEIHDITDRITVLRDGQVVATRESASVDNDELIELIVGRRLEAIEPGRSRVGSDIILGVDHLSGGRIEDVSLTLCKGEIVGITGLVGMGFEDLPYLLVGAQRAKQGHVTLGRDTVPAEAIDPKTALRAGIVLVPAHRERDGGVFTLSVGENITMPRINDFYRRLRLDSRAEKEFALELTTAFGVRPPEPTRLFGSLSGGNQQKAIMAKWLSVAPRVLLLHEPTQGVDVAARVQIRSEIEVAAVRGAGVIVSSIEYEELADLCDRVLIMQDGHVVSELRGQQVTKDRILEHAYRPVQEQPEGPPS